MTSDAIGTSLDLVKRQSPVAAVTERSRSPSRSSPLQKRAFDFVQRTRLVVFRWGPTLADDPCIRTDDYPELSLDELASEVLY